MLTMRDLIPRSRGRDVAAGRAAEHPLMAFQRDMNTLFEDLWRGFDVPPAGRGEAVATAMIAPRIELTETDKEIVVCAELPGLSDNDVEITLSDNVLSIRGEKKVDKTEEDKGYTYTERSYGSFERRIPIDADVLADKVAARFADGVLSVTLPKNPDAKEQVRRIPIGGGGAAPGEHKTEPTAA